MKIVITGASGFIGSALVQRSLAQGNQCIGLTSNPSHPIVHQLLRYQTINSYEEEIPNLDFKAVDVVIHTAAKVHQMNGSENEKFESYQKVNRDLTLQLAEKAASSGVKRFVFISSIKVNGEVTGEQDAFNENAPPPPLSDPYARSKYEAEQGLLALYKNSNMEVVIIRPPLVYGPGVKANFARLIKVSESNIPILLPHITNRRSLIALDNLVGFIMHCANYDKTPQAAGQTYLISDGEDVSTINLIKKIATASEKPLKIWLLPRFLNPLILFLFAKNQTFNKLFSSLALDSTKAREQLGWLPDVTMEQQLKTMFAKSKREPK